MRLSLPWGRAALFAAMFAGALVLAFPLRLAASWFGLDRFGISAREVSGSVWRGRLGEARIADFAAGDVGARLNLLPLAMGRVRVDFTREGESADLLRGAISIGRNSVGIDDATARLPLGTALAPLPLLAIDLTDLSARFRDGMCRSAEGRVRAEIDGAVLGLALPGGLSGNARCDGGALLLPLVSQSAMESVSLRLFAGNRYRADFVVRPGEGGSERLLAAGFAPSGDAYMLSVNGGF
jgi:general secretion pathway protein N